MAKIRKFAKENKIVLKIENYKNHLEQRNKERKEKIHYVLTFKADNKLLESLKEYLEKLRLQTQASLQTQKSADETKK